MYITEDRASGTIYFLQSMTSDETQHRQDEGLNNEMKWRRERQESRLVIVEFLGVDIEWIIVSIAKREKGREH